MNSDQLWDTTMNPGPRTLKQVTIESAAEADRIFSMLMGDEVAPRRISLNLMRNMRSWTCNGGVTGKYFPAKWLKICNITLFPTRAACGGLITNLTCGSRR